MRNAILAGLTILAPLASWAADNYTPLDVKLGLWESTSSNQMSGTLPIPEDLLSRLTPEQRAKMEAAMKAQIAKSAQPKTTKSCLTKEELSKPMLFGNDASSCKPSLLTSTSNKQEIHFDCDDKNGIKAAGNIHIEALNSENVKATGQVTANGGPNQMNMQMSYSAKWLGADCGPLGKK
jgi:Protein of unknown function (DUF3617)